MQKVDSNLRRDLETLAGALSVLSNHSFVDEEKTEESVKEQVIIMQDLAEMAERHLDELEHELDLFK